MRTLRRAFRALLIMLAVCCAVGGGTVLVHAQAVPRALASDALTVAPPAVGAPVALVYDPDTGAILFDHNGEEQHAMASTTKIMTALVALRDGQPDASITVTNDIHSLDGTGGSVMGLAVGQRFTLRELLYGLLVPSGDDAAVAIADGIAGSQSAFVARMNALALHLGLLHTHYVNVHGLDAPGHYTTALDLAWLTRVAMRVPLFHQIVGTASFTIAATATHPAFTLATTNKLLLYAGAFGVLGIKTGFTGNAGYCLVAEMSQTNRHVITVVFGEPDDTTRFTDSAALLAWGLATERGSRRAS